MTGSDMGALRMNCPDLTKPPPPRRTLQYHSQSPCVARGQPASGPDGGGSASPDRGPHRGFGLSSARGAAAHRGVRSPSRDHRCREPRRPRAHAVHGRRRSRSRRTSGRPRNRINSSAPERVLQGCPRCVATAGIDGSCLPESTLWRNACGVGGRGCERGSRLACCGGEP